MFFWSCWETALSGTWSVRFLFCVGLRHSQIAYCACSVYVLGHDSPVIFSSAGKFLGWSNVLWDCKITGQFELPLTAMCRLCLKQTYLT